MNSHLMVIAVLLKVILMSIAGHDLESISPEHGITTTASNTSTTDRQRTTNYVDSSLYNYGRGTITWKLASGTKLYIGNTSNVNENRTSSENIPSVITCTNTTSEVYSSIRDYATSADKKTDGTLRLLINASQNLTELLATNIVGSTTTATTVTRNFGHLGNVTTSGNNGYIGLSTAEYGERELFTTKCAIHPNFTEVNSHEGYYWQEKMAGEIYKWGSPFLIIVGTLGNLLSVTTLQHSLFRSTSTGFILTALAIIDMLFLNTGLMNKWLGSTFGIYVRDFTGIGCKIHVLLSYYLHQLSSWTLILLTFERTISVAAPLRCKELCSKRRIIIAWCLISVVLFAEHIFLFQALDLQPSSCPNNAKTTGNCTECNPRREWEEFFNVYFAYIDGFLGDWFPFIVVFLGNAITISVIARSHRARQKQMGVSATNNNNSGKLVASTTAMLLGVSAMFIICSLPIDALIVYYGNRKLLSEELAVRKFAFAVVTMFYYGNSAFGFLVYLLSGSKFRRALKQTFTCRNGTGFDHSRNSTSIGK